MRVPLRALFITCMLAIGCAETVTAPPHITDSIFPSVRGESLAQKSVRIPEDYRGKPTLLLIGYAQKAQFDIDRWILGVLQADIPVQIVELPTIAGMMPQMVQGFINNGMRKGIPSDDWASVVTIYEDAPKIIAALGNERPQSAYAVLLNNDSRIVWSSSIGYSASQIIELKRTVEGLPR